MNERYEALKLKVEETRRQLADALAAHTPSQPAPHAPLEELVGKLRGLMADTDREALGDLARHAVFLHTSFRYFFSAPANGVSSEALNMARMHLALRSQRQCLRFYMKFTREELIRKKIYRAEQTGKNPEQTDKEAPNA